MDFHPWVIMVIALISFKIFFLFNNALRNTGFNENYTVTLGNQHVLFLNQGREVQLSLDRSSGAGFQSKEYFGSGYFQMRIKLPDKDSAGVVTAFYISTTTNSYGTDTKLYTVHLPLVANDGGRSKANYSNVPFQAHFRDFNIDGCPSIPTNPNKECHSTKYWWNGKKYNHLNPNQLKAYENVRKKYMTYDYCADRRRYPTPPPECIR
ncbi:Concanavalin A-like lectin/glucanase superfamily [Cynara cardunculus var. scolymus]|uniref:Xyloglucan endotransglucosylase/hydrolase n=1 Tax=Cynara cardunculus var. scolymus TaxID=59895 RepID=A0A103XP59_CYNCS|nr:Concanavalin A-like lectin/glucanase superfamily [Cynara cardunculus var. scolymus]